MEQEVSALSSERPDVLISEDSSSSVTMMMFPSRRLSFGFKTQKSFKLSGIMNEIFLSIKRFCCSDILKSIKCFLLFNKTVMP